MKTHGLFEAEYKLLKIIWNNEPVNSTHLVKLCEEKLEWKKSTTYTMLRKIIQKEYAINENATVISIVKEEEIKREHSNEVVKKVFNNSLPSFVTAFMADNKLSNNDIKELRKIIGEAKND